MKCSVRFCKNSVYFQNVLHRFIKIMFKKAGFFHNLQTFHELHVFDTISKKLHSFVKINSRNSKLAQKI